MSMPGSLRIVPVRLRSGAGSGPGPGLPRGSAGPRRLAPASVVSPEIAADRRVTFRIYAPKAQAVRLAAGDIPGVGQAQRR